jgi:hypothetical protein
MENIENLNGKIFVIRHAQSMYNAAKNDKKLMKIRDSDKSFIDACLSETGEIQCKENKKMVRIRRCAQCIPRFPRGNESKINF